MGPDEGHAAEWTEAAAYAPLLAADRSILAWEWLRRDPSYRTAARSSGASIPVALEVPRPEHWGLHAFEDPDLAAPDARPVWRADVHPYVLPAVAERVAESTDAHPDALDPARLGSMATLVAGVGGHEHWLISDGLRAIRLDLLEGTLSRGPVRLRYLLTGFESAERPLLTLRRLIALRKTGRFSRSLHRPEARARRWLLVLRAWDALWTGADQREIASELLSVSALEPRWRSGESSLRSQAQRLVRAARVMAKGGYRELLE
jgi:hypothetical protein